MFKRKTELCTLQSKTNQWSKKEHTVPNITNATNCKSFENNLLDPVFQQNAEHFKENINESLHFMSWEGIYILKHVYFLEASHRRVASSAWLH